MTHWAATYIGTPWRYGAKGPDAFDCWNFVREIQHARFGVEVPMIEYADQRDVARQLQHNAELDHWAQVEMPTEGDIVMMARAKIPAHVGIWVAANNDQGILHCLQGSGVIFTKESAIRSSGWGQLKYYRRKDDH